METVIRARQKDYYRALAMADQQAEATLFIEFMLSVLRDALRPGSTGLEGVER